MKRAKRTEIIDFLIPILYNARKNKQEHPVYSHSPLYPFLPTYIIKKRKGFVNIVSAMHISLVIFKNLLKQRRLAALINAWKTLLALSQSRVKSAAKGLGRYLRHRVSEQVSCDRLDVGRKYAIRFGEWKKNQANAKRALHHAL